MCWITFMSNFALTQLIEIGIFSLTHHLLAAWTPCASWAYGDKFVCHTASEAIKHVELTIPLLLPQRTTDTPL